MSIGVDVSARKILSQEELELVTTYNSLVNNGIEVPQELLARLRPFCGDDCDMGYEPIVLDLQDDTFIELDAPLHGDVMYGDGAILKIAELPPGTVELRIYAG